ncbi:conserved oligomeric Golgi complex subunit 5 [Anabrus simplex]|uniref:conserved oligomeric Golgi complex subunit 5 n=1 Tax=Anabrus simplex TaxID=316456 RepID=UPI0034DCDE60
MANADVWQIIETDEFYRQFLRKDSGEDIKNEAIIQGFSVAEQLKKLAEGISLLDKELQRQVLENHEDLLSQATWIEKLEGVLSVMQSHVQCLLSAVERLRTKIIEPFNKVEMQTMMLSNLHATSDLLRRVTRIQHLSKRLNALMQAGPAGTIDIIKAAQSLSELSQITEDVDLSGLEVVEEELRTIRLHRNDVEKQTRLMLNQGLQSQNQTQVTTAVQVFSNLGSLSTTVSQVMEGAKQRVTRSIKEALDVQTLTHVATADASKTRGAPGRAAMPSPGNASMFRSRLWSALEHLFDSSIYTECSQIELLQRVLLKKVRDLSLVSHIQNAAYIDLLPKDQQELTSNFWLEVSTQLSRQLIQASQSASFLKQTLEGEYPKFLRLYLDLCKRLQAVGRSSDQGEIILQDAEPQAGKTAVFELNRDVVVAFENAYLSRSVSRLLDPVNLMFSGEVVPSHEEVDSLIRTITSELSVSLVDVSLSRTVARNISKTVRLFCLKCEQMTVTGGEATQVIDSCTPGQLTNISIANLLHYLNGQVARVVSNMKNSLPSDTISIVLESLQNTDELTRGIVNPILSSITDAIEAIILTMHNEDYSMGPVPNASTNMATRKPDAPCSLYMKELQDFISRAVKNYLAVFQNQDVVSKCCVSVAGRCLELFLRHACLVRPLGEGGRMKLAADFAQMELAVAPLCRQVSELGRPYKMLRSFRPLLFLTVEDIQACTALGDVIPYSLVLLSLFARGPQELLSPHQSANWSVSRFSQWLDTHPSERERLELMSGALQRYQQTVRQRGETKFHSVYPVMVNLLERGMKTAGK